MRFPWQKEEGPVFSARECWISPDWDKDEFARGQIGRTIVDGEGKLWRAVGVASTTYIARAPLPTGEIPVQVIYRVVPIKEGM